MKGLARFLAPACLLAAVVTLWIRFQPLSSPDTPFQLELAIASPIGGEAWVRFNCGAGWNIQDTRTIWLRQSARPLRYRVTLPAGDFKLFRLLPPDSERPAVLAGARILDADGATVATMPGAGYSPELKTIPFSLAEPLRITADGEKTWIESGLEFACLSALFALTAAWLSRRNIRLNCPARIAAWMQSHPRSTVLGAALLAVVIGCHPVVFFGRSFISPNNGTLCLYDLQPTLPGAPQHVEEWTRSDVNATPWAHLPYSMITHDAVLRDGQLPLWNRFNMAGFTLLGQGQSMPGDPLFWIPVCANGAAWAWDLRFLAAKALFAFGIGLLVLQITRRPGVSALLAFSAAFIGFYSFRFNHPAVFTLGYAPWILVCWFAAAGSDGLRRTIHWSLALIAANWLLLNSGTAKEASMLLLMLNATGALALLLRPDARRWPKLGVMAAGCIAFLGISAPLWIIFLDALRHAATIYDRAMAHQIAPGLAIGLFDDLFYRQLVLDEWHVNPSLNFLALAGVLWALVDRRRVLANPFTRALAWMSLPALAFVFGVVPPAVIERLPLLGNIGHVDNTFSCVLVVLLLPLAGAGIASCLDCAGKPEWTAMFRQTLLLLATLAAVYLGTVFAVPALDEFSLRTTRPATLSRFFAGYAPALLAAAALLPWLARRAVLRRGSMTVNGLAILLCLAAVHFRHGMWLETKFDYYVMNPQPRVSLQAHSPALDALQTGEPARTVGVGRVLQPGFNAVLGLESIAGADAVGNRALVEWFEATGLGARWAWSPVVTPESMGSIQPFLDAMNVRYYLASAGTGSINGLRKTATADLEVFTSDTAWPRAFFTDRVARYDQLAGLAHLIASSNSQPLAAISSKDPALNLPSNIEGRHSVPAHDYRLTSNGTSFTIDAPSAGVAVLTESVVPKDFVVTINGARGEVLRFNHLFKGVWLPAAGTYRITFEYCPHLLTPALRLAAFSAVLVLAAAVFGLRRAAPVSPLNSGSLPSPVTASAAP